MKVAMVCPYSFSVPGGVQSHALGLSEWLGLQGHEVSLLGPGQVPASQFATHQLDPRSFTSLGRPLPIRYNGSVARLTFGPVTHARVAAWLRGVRPDVIHVHEPITPSASVLAVWARNAPVVATFHTATPGSRSMELAGRLMTRTVGAIDAGIAVSSVACDVVRHHIGLDPQVIGNGIRVADHPIGLPQGRWRGGEGPRITFLGRFEEPRKGFGVFLEAISRLREAWPRLDVVVAGDGRPRAIEGVRFLGRLDDVQRNALLASTDVYVAPQTGRESFGIVLLEALASGCQVVASDLPAFLEVLTDDAGRVGTVFTSGDPVSLAANLHLALRSVPDRQRGRRLAETYDWQCIGPKVLEVYQRAAAAGVDGGIARIA